MDKGGDRKIRSRQSLPVSPASKKVFLENTSDERTEI